MAPVKRTKPKKPVYTAINGSIRVPIYKINLTKPKPMIRYSVMWYEGKGARKEIRRAKLEDAKRFASDKAKELLSARKASDRLKSEQKESYVLAQDIVGKTPIVTVAREWKKAMELTDGALIPAAQAWRDQHLKSIQPLTVDQVAGRFRKAKEKAGINWVKSYQKTLPRFLEVFGSKKISTLTTRRLQGWLEDSFENATTRNTHRKRLVTLWSWARKQGYLPRNIQTEMELTDRAEEKDPKRGIIKPDTLRALFAILSERHPHYLAPLALGALCGLRPIEVHKQIWEDMLLEENRLRVTGAKAGTAQFRDVPICDSAIEWLMLAPSKIGPVCGNLANERIRDIGVTAGLELPENCFRHSWISYRVVTTGNVDQTALEAGNSARVIHKHYRQLVTKAEAEEWFSIRPLEEVRKVVQFEEV